MLSQLDIVTDWLFKAEKELLIARLALAKFKESELSELEDKYVSAPYSEAKKNGATKEELAEIKTKGKMKRDIAWEKAKKGKMRSLQMKKKKDLVKRLQSAKEEIEIKGFTNLSLSKY